jgi:hypothetical protein
MSLNPETQRRIGLAVFVAPYVAFFGYVTLYHLRRNA